MGLPGQRPGSRGGGPPNGVSTRQHVWVLWWEGSEVPPSCPGPTPASHTQAACRSPSHPVCCWEGPGPSARPSRPQTPAFGSLLAVWGQRRFTPLPCYRPLPHLTHRRCSVHITGWADAPDTPSGSGCVFSLGIPQQCKEMDTPMGGVFTTLSMPFLLWGPQLYSQWYSSPTQYFYV